jgi:hypothetical protein
MATTTKNNEIRRCHVLRRCGSEKRNEKEPENKKSTSHYSRKKREKYSLNSPQQ